MPNRIIKESICTSDNLNLLSGEEETFFYRLIVNCDDFGLMDARSSILRAKLFPLRVDKLKEKDVESWVQALVSSNLIFLYENSGRRYLKMTNWENHQQTRATKSKYPTPDDDLSNPISIDINCNQVKSTFAERDRTRIRISNTNTITNIGGVGEKQQYAQFVFMLPEEYEKLVNQFGEDVAKDKIEDLNLWKGSKGKKTASDYLTISNWDRRDKKDREKLLQNKPPGIPQTGNFEQRQYKKKDMNNLYEDV